MLTLRKLTKTPQTLISRIHNATSHFSTTPNPTHYDDLINTAGRNHNFSAVCHLLKTRLENGCLNTIKTFNFIARDLSVLPSLLHHLSSLEPWFTRKHALDSLISQLSKLHRHDEAVLVAETMIKNGYGPTTITFLPILNSMAKKKAMGEAWHVIEIMKEANVGPDLTAFNYVLTAYCFVGDVESAFDVLGRMEKEGLVADSRTYDALVLGACRAGKVEGAVAVMRRMEEDGVKALFCTHGHVIKEMVSCGYVEQAVEYVRAFAGRDGKMDAENYRYLVSRLKKGKRIEEAEVVVEEMVRRGLVSGDGLKDLSTKSGLE